MASKKRTHTTNSGMELVVVSGDHEWDGLYVDGQLVCENHSLSWFEVLRDLPLGRPIKSIKTMEVSSEWLDDRGNLPDLLKDIPKDVVASSRKI